MSDAVIAVEASGLRKTFGDTVAVDDVSFAIEAGRSLAMLGANGAGKTTTMRMVTTTLKPDAGTIAVAGIDALESPLRARQQLGLVAQRLLVDPDMTGREHLLHFGRLCHLPRSRLRAHAAEMLELFRLSDVGDRLARHYSGGMQRRLDIAIAMVHSPPVLVLDEPTVGLDLESRLQLWDVLRGLMASGVAILYTTQIFDDVKALEGDVMFIAKGSVRRRTVVGEFDDAVPSRITVRPVTPIAPALLLDIVGSLLERVTLVEPPGVALHGDCPTDVDPQDRLVELIGRFNERSVELSDVELSSQPPLESIYLDSIRSAAASDDASPTDSPGDGGSS
ncbi:MAG: ATP-binding cassette domain-containing protein [Actinomycetota bacterium]